MLWAKCVIVLDISLPSGVDCSWQPQHCGWAEACSELWWSHNMLHKRGAWNLQKCIFTGWKPLCSPGSWPSLENSLLFIPPCACAKSLSNYIGSVPQLQAQKIWLAGRNEQPWTGAWKCHRNSRNLVIIQACDILKYTVNLHSYKEKNGKHSSSFL